MSDKTGDKTEYTDNNVVRDEYDFSKGIRGKYAVRYAEGTNIVVLDPDVAEMFPDSSSVNSALRELIKIARRDHQKEISAP
jgi:hypothetical protein